MAMTKPTYKGFLKYDMRGSGCLGKTILSKRKLLGPLWRGDETWENSVARLVGDFNDERLREGAKTNKKGKSVTL